MERHTMWDGIIPLSGLSPSAVSRQWGNAGINDGKTYGDFSLPISVSNVLAVFALDFDTSSSNGASIGDYYTVTYKPSFSNNSRLRFVTKGAAMGGFNALVICK